MIEIQHHLVLQCKCMLIYIDSVGRGEDTQHNTYKTPMIVKENTDIMTLNFSRDLEYLSMDVNLYSGEAYI